MPLRGRDPFSRQSRTSDESLQQSLQRASRGGRVFRQPTLSLSIHNADRWATLDVFMGRLTVEEQYTYRVVDRVNFGIVNQFFVACQRSMIVEKMNGTIYLGTHWVLRMPSRFRVSLRTQSLWLGRALLQHIWLLPDDFLQEKRLPLGQL